MPKRYENGELSYEQIFEKLIRYCDYQERCKSEIIRKSELLGLSDKDEINQLISDLEESGYLDEIRFARLYVNGKFQFKKWGVRRIERELEIKKVPKDVYKKFIDDLDKEQYEEQFVTLAEKKWTQIKGKSFYDKKSKLFRYLYTKGYQSDLITQFLKNLSSDQ